MILTLTRFKKYATFILKYIWPLIYELILNLDDTPSYSASFAPIRRFTSDFWNNCLFDALGSNSHPAKLHADVLALLYRQFHVLTALNNKLWTWNDFNVLFFKSNRDTQVSEYSLELLLLQVIMPCLLEQNHARKWLLYGLKMWCLAVSWFLGLRSYLLGDVASSSEVLIIIFSHQVIFPG